MYRICMLKITKYWIDQKVRLEKTQVNVLANPILRKKWDLNKLERLTMFTGWKIQHSKDINSPQVDLQV